MDGLTPGRMVHYIADGGIHRAAVVTHVFDGRIINLFVFDDGISPLPSPVVRHVGFDEQMQPHTWHWIEKA